MAFTRNLIWNNAVIPFPTTMSWSFQDVSSSESGRTLSGKMNKEVVATKRKLSCSWKMLDDAKASQLLGAVKAMTYGTLNYPDAFIGSNVTKTFYSGDATADMKAVNENKFVWDVSFEFIEQ